MKSYFLLLARYNAWANHRLYHMASQLPDEAYRRDAGVYFKSLHGTLNHLLVADRIWLRRLTGSGEQPTRLDAILYDDLAALTAARRAEDERLLRYVEGLPNDQFEARLNYQTLAGAPMQQKVLEILAHLFNHQTHHRGQCHAILTRLGVEEPVPLDLLIMLMER